MDARYLNPFVTSTALALSVMAGLEVKRGVPFVKGAFQALADISGVIGLAGRNSGAVVLSFSFPLAARIYEAVTGTKASRADEGLKDLVGELANMVAGGAKAALSEVDTDFRISVPSVVAGPLHSVVTKTETPCVIIPFEVGPDTFWLQVALSRAPQDN